MARWRPSFVLAAALMAGVASGCAPTLTPRLQLIAAWPAKGESLPVGRHTLSLTFNAPLDARATTASVTSLRSELQLDTANPRQLMVRLVDPRSGSYQLRWHAVAADTRDISEGEEAFTLRDESEMPPRLDVFQTDTSDVNQPLDLAGNGFARNSTVTLTMGDDDQPLATVSTNAGGSFKAQPKVLESMPYGVQPLTATDELGHRASTAVEVRWGGWPPAVPIDSGEPGPGLDQITFTVKVRNRSDYVLEHITLVVKDPIGAQFVGTDPGARREDREVVWDIPILARGVVGPFRATYTASMPVVSQAWMEFRHRPQRGCIEHCQPAFISDSAAESMPVAPSPSGRGT